MSTFENQIEVGSFDGSRFRVLTALVDTGATYTSIPRNILEELGVSVAEERPFILANGERVTYGMAWIRIRLEGREQPTPAVFGQVGSEILLGAVTLEELGLGVDVLNQRFVPTPAYLVGLKKMEGV